MSDSSASSESPPSLSQPINDTTPRRLLTLCNVAVARLFQRKRWSPSLLRLSPWTCVKLGTFRDLCEARTMQYIASNTSIPVPKVYCSFQRRRKSDGTTTTYVVMERIRGETLASAWPTLSASSRDKILLQLRHFVQEMRNLPAPKREHKISNVDGGSLWDCRLVSGVDRFGPFKDAQAFHLFLRNGLEKAPPELPEVDEMIKLQARDWGPVVFTHGDLSSLNILVRGDRIVGIVDWETAGWFPPYWEYTTACQVNPRNTFWAEWIDRFLDPWPDALKMERVRQRWWGVI
ncbi:hypothetical protein ABEF95_012076 [Exophiala dermatitidis]